MLSDVLKKIRRERNLTRKELAKELDMPPSTLGNYELGTRTPHDVATWSKIAQYCNVSIDDLMGSKTNTPLYLAYTSSDDKKNELIDLINNADLTDSQIDLLLNTIKVLKKE